MKTVINNMTPFESVDFAWQRGYHQAIEWISVIADAANDPNTRRVAAKIAEGLKGSEIEGREIFLAMFGTKTSGDA